MSTDFTVSAEERTSPKKARRIIVEDENERTDDDGQGSALDFKDLPNLRQDTARLLESVVGERVAFPREMFQAKEADAEDDDEAEPQEDYLSGTCEGWSPARKAFLVIFDEPFSEAFDSFKASGRDSDPGSSHKSEEQGSHEKKSWRKRTKVTPTRLSVAIWNDKEKYITYDVGDLGSFGGSCTIRRGIPERRSCHWWAAWVGQREYFKSSKKLKDEPVYCVCFRMETAEPPPPLTSDGSEADSDKCTLVSCESCEEWFHMECALMVSSQRKSLNGAINTSSQSRKDSASMQIESAETWTCPLCDGSVQIPRPRSPDASDVPSTEPSVVNNDAVLSARVLAWKQHSLQKQLAWKHPLFEWQWWSNGPASEGEGDWVFSVSTLRRFVNRKGVDDSLLARSDLASKGISILLNDSYLTCPESPSDQQAEDSYWVLAIDGLRTETDQNSSTDEPRAAAGIRSTSPSDAILGETSNLVSLDTRPQLGLPCSRTRPVEKHMAIIRKRKRRERKKALGVTSATMSSVGPAQTSSSSFSNPSTDEGRHQRLNTRHIASAVGESALTIGRRRQLRFGRSNIHMWGVFADEPIGAGEFVAEYMGELISQQETDRRFAEYMAKGMSDYLFRIDDNLICDATMKGSVARFINHSCEPSCEAKIVSHQNQKKIALYALRDIAVGEELCYDYKFPIEEGAENKIPCNCGAKRCRRVMN